MSKSRVCAANQKGVYGKRKKAASKSALTVGGDGSAIAPPPEVSADPIAAKRWAWIAESHRKMNYTLHAGDVEAASRLCITYADMERIRRKIEAESDTALFAALNRLLDAKARICIGLEDRLLLNPTSRMRGIPKEATPKEVPENLKGIAHLL
jgi:hypothetical protein